MPLTPLQRQILSVIAKHRDAESFVAGGTVIQRAGIRRSRDIDIFHDAEQRLRLAAAEDLGALQSAGFEVSLEIDGATFVRAIVGADDDRTKLEWVVDSEFRFFPVIPDDEFGFVLRPDGTLAQPDPDRPETLADLVVHHGSRKGAWPSSPEIGSVMLRERR